MMFRTFLLCIVFALTFLTGCNGDNSNSSSSVPTSEIMPTTEISPTTDITPTTAPAQTTTEPAVTLEATPSADITAAEDAAYAYYKNTIIQVKSMEVANSNGNIVKFTVYAMKDGEECEPRTIVMKKNEGKWEVFSEGY